MMPGLPRAEIVPRVFSPADTGADAERRQSPVPPGLFAWYAPGFSDGLGDRLLLFDNTDGRPLELLRLCPTIAAARDCEALLRERAREIGDLGDQRFARVCRVDRLPEPGGGLAIVSEHVEGRRLSEFLGLVHERSGRLSPDLSLGLVAKLAAAVATLHRRGPHIAHGALAPDRLVVGPAGRLVVTEYVFGASLARLDLDPAACWRAFRVALPAGQGPSALDQQADVLQIGLVALAVLIGRPLGVGDYPDAIRGLVGEAARRAGEAGWDTLRWLAMESWLLRTLCLDSDVRFSNAGEAAGALEPLIQPGATPWDTFEHGTAEPAPPPTHPRALEPPTGEAAPLIAPLTPASLPPPVDIPARTPPSPASPASAPTPVASPSTHRHLLLPALVLSVALPAAWLAAHLLAGARSPASGSGTGAATNQPAVPGEARPAAGSEGGVLLDVRSEPAGASVFVDGRPRGVTPVLVRDLAAGEHQVRVESGGRSVTQAVKIEPTRAAAIFIPFSRSEAPAAGWLAISSPVELQVFEDDRFVGTSRSERIMLPSGLHRVSLVSEEVGYRATREVNVPVGKMATIDVALPDGRADINAAPWAEVWIDGQKAGDTPLAGLPLKPGKHVVTFKHPRLGERTLECFVTLQQPLRLSADLRK